MLYLFVIPVQAQYVVDWEKYIDNQIAGTWTNSDYAQQCAVDVSPNGDFFYVVGETGSGQGSELINNCNSAKINLSGNDAFIAKYDKCGNLQWLHYFGVDLPEKSYCMARAYTLKLDKVNDITYIYVAGIVHDMPGTTVSCYQDSSATAIACNTSCTPPVFQAKNAGNYEGFIAKYDESGKLLKWTYLGGNDRDYIFGMDIIDHNVFVCGFTENTYSELVPLGSKYYDNKYWGDGQAFVAAFDQNLCQCLFFSYLGGEQDVRAHDVKGYNVSPSISDQGFYLSGTTSSPIQSFEPGITYNIMGPAFLSGSSSPTHAFISHWKFDATMGYKLDWLRYLQGNGVDRGRQLVLCPPSGSSLRKDAIIVGSTNSDNLLSYSIPMPVTTGLYQNLNQNLNETEKDAFLMRFRSNGAAVWGTYFGGTDDDDGGGIDYYSAKDLIAFSGNTRSTNFPLKNAIQSNLAALYQKDSYIALISNPSYDNQIQTLKFSTYLGGGKDEYSNINDYFGANLAMGSGTSIYFSTYTKSKNIEDKFKSPDYHFNTRTTTDQDGFIGRIFDVNSATVNCSTFLWRNEVSSQGISLEEHNLIISPNPAQYSTTIICPFESEEAIDLQIVDVFGHCITTKQIYLDKTSNSFIIDLKEFPSGIYFVRISNKGNSKLGKMVVQQ
jgi:hypothetical protein